MMSVGAIIALIALGVTIVTALIGIGWRLGTVLSKLTASVEVFADAIKELKTEQAANRQTATSVAVLTERVDNMEGDVQSLRNGGIRRH